MAKMTEEEWQNLYENFETYDLLTAIDHLDQVRGILADGVNWEPPEIRNDLLTLHQLAMDVVNNGWTEKASELFTLAYDIETEVFRMVESLEYIHERLHKLAELFPESLLYGDDE